MRTTPHEEMLRHPIYSRSISGRPPTEWELLINHAMEVGIRAARFADKFGAGEAGRLAGYLHDVGKVSAAFQAYLQGKAPGPDHSTAGARLADSLFPSGIDRLMARLVALAIAGHHAGLADGDALPPRLARDVPDFSRWREVTPALPNGITPRLRGQSGASYGYKLAFLGRMIFSCLVDADSLAAEAFAAAVEGYDPPRRSFSDIAELRDRLDRFLAGFAGKTGDLNQHRAEILASARAKAELSPGLFTMTVPTGGGKTLASVAFALDHAALHRLDRVVYVIPYTSIIEQTAAIFRRALSDADGAAPDVLEHTGTVDWDGQEDDATDAGARETLARLRRATENWDAPIIVTTAVQFFESLHADRRSRCRKLHNLANSVIILDEAQTLPVSLLRPCMAAIDELAAAYGASVVLCTATQPAITEQSGFERKRGGLDVPPERELAPDPQALYKALTRRVRVEHVGARTDAALAERFATRDQMLCIVNSRSHAQALFALIRDLPGARHLTTLMCPAHRRQALAAIRHDLKAGRPVRLISTSLIEAGVDVDFPEVWRAENGLDSIAQAAGRCNREGRLTQATATVFVAADHALPPMFRQQVAAMQTTLRLHPDDPLGLDAVKAYFNHLYWMKGDAQLDAATLDGKPYPIMARLRESVGPDLVPVPPFASVAAAFRMIDDPGLPVIVPWRGGEEPDAVVRLVAALCHAPTPPAGVLRALQQFIVTIPRPVHSALKGSGAIQALAAETYGDRFMLVQDFGLYSEATGLTLDPFGEVGRDLQF